MLLLPMFVFFTSYCGLARCNNVIFMMIFECSDYRSNPPLTPDRFVDLNIEKSSCIWFWKLNFGRFPLLCLHWWNNADNIWLVDGVAAAETLCSSDDVASHQDTLPSTEMDVSSECQFGPAVPPSTALLGILWLHCIQDNREDYYNCHYC